MTRAGLEPAPTVRHLSGWSAHPFPVLSFRGGRRPPWESVPHFCDGERTQRGRRLPRRFAPRNDRNARMRHAKPSPSGGGAPAGGGEGRFRTGPLSHGLRPRQLPQRGSRIRFIPFHWVGADLCVGPLWVPAPGAHTGAPLPVATGSGGKMTRAGLEPAPTVRHLSGWSAHPFPVLSFRGGRRPPWESVPHFCDGERTQRGRRLPRRFAPRNDRNARMRHAKPPPMGKAWSTAIPHS